MSVTATVSGDHNTAILKISGRFDFSVHNDFRKAYKEIDIEGGEYIVDLMNTEYLDSSALGMMLLLKEYAEGSGSKVRISNANSEILEILKIASFDKLFSVN
ncbi:MAG: STAS domain-containing protein [Gammaproteobacteria bacterium]|nr:STAS domain-containing protein [Gammaproteobacteria bacterium]MCW8910377.1 STAS domain-containing protein [Gammaproteobacteria bacterium]MCW9004841.1 STAS domain-containing protein [Gammaproteobacteria bacterium]MCW9056750.1 STAS domain-containing protein [Gammaproteobacteria bacterium]